MACPFMLETFCWEGFPFDGMGDDELLMGLGEEREDWEDSGGQGLSPGALRTLLGVWDAEGRRGDRASPSRAPLQPARRERLLRLLGEAGIEEGELEGAWGTGRPRPGSSCECALLREFRALAQEGRRGGGGGLLAAPCALSEGAVRRLRDIARRVVVPGGGTGGMGKLPQAFESEMHQAAWGHADVRGVCEGVVEGWQEHEAVGES